MSTINTNKFITILACTLVALLLLLQLQWSGRRMLAEFGAFPAIAKMEWWSMWDIEPPEDEWLQMRSRMQDSLQRMPAAPNLLTATAYLHFQRLNVDNLPAERISEEVALGSYYYRRSLKQRPTWVYDWADLALINYNQERFSDAEFQLALRQMIRFGETRFGLRRLLIDMSITAWPELNDETRAVLSSGTNVEQVRAQRNAAGETN